MLDKRQIRAIFFILSSKWVIKQWRQLIISKIHLGQELLMNIQCSGGSRILAKETGALTMSAVAGRQNLTWPVEKLIKADTPTNTREAVEELSVSHSVVIWHWKQLGKVKKLDKWVPHELSTDKKKIILECPFFLLYRTMNHFSIGLC